MGRNTIKSTKCLLVQALLGTYVHFCSHLPLFCIWIMDVTFAVEFMPIVKMQLSAKSACVRAHFLLLSVMSYGNGNELSSKNID